MTILLLCVSVYIIQRGTSPLDAPEKNNNQPHIVLFRDQEKSELPELHFVCVEQQLILESSSLQSAIFLCLAAHYILNLEYHAKGRDVWLFIQEKILQLPTKRKGTKVSPSTSTHFSGITHLCEQNEQSELNKD